MQNSAAPPRPHPMIRLWGIVKPIRARLVLGLLCAIGSAVLGLMIPQVLERLVNSDLVQGGTATAVWTAGATVLVLGIFEALLLFLRRVFALVPATGIERDMRTDLYDKIQDMPVTFHDQWSSGQLLSRAMSDTNLIRRWIAFGVIMGVTTAVTTIVGIALLIRASWILALVFVAAAIPIGIFSFRFNRQFSTLSLASRRIKTATSPPQSNNPYRASAYSKPSAAAPRLSNNSPSRPMSFAEPRSKRPPRSRASTCSCTAFPRLPPPSASCSGSTSRHTAT